MDARIVRLAAAALMLIGVCGLGLGLGPALSSGAGAAARQRTAETAPPDLAAMALRPDDAPDPGYGLWAGFVFTVEQQASAVNEARGGDEDTLAELVADLTEAGWQRGHQVEMALPDAADPTLAGQIIISILVAYDDAEGAAAGFALIEDETGVEDVIDVPRVRTIGDESEITFDRRAAEDPTLSYVTADLTFRIDNLTGTVAIIDFTGQDPAAGALEDLAQVLLDRIEETRADGAAPESSTRAARLAGADIFTYYDQYERLGEETFPYFAETADGHTARDDGYDAYGVIDAYYLYQTIRPVDDPDHTLYTLYVQTFADEAAAAAWLRQAPSGYVANPGAGVEAAVAPDAATFGDGSATISVRSSPADGSAAEGYTVYLHVEQTGAIVHLDGTAGLPLSAVEELAAAQAACLERGACLEPLPAPDVRGTPAPERPPVPPVLPPDGSSATFD